MAVFLELADIGARHERLVAGAGQDHDTHIGIVAQLDQRLAQPLPHLERHGVALVWIVEGNDADPIGDALQDLAVGIGFVGGFGDVEHRWGFRVK